MKIQHQFLSILAMLFLLIAALSCDRKAETEPITHPNTTTKSAHVDQSKVTTQKTGRTKYEAKPHDPKRMGLIVGTIKFVVRDPDPVWADYGPSPYVSMENPGKAIKYMDKPDEIVVSSNELHVVIDYPVTGEWEFKITSGGSKGFTRAELAREISRVYHALYVEEERTTKIKVIPPKERKKLYNRNQTDGKFGIWGHDIGDLELHTVELHKGADGKLYAILGIDS
jgi:hypothetical protein